MVVALVPLVIIVVFVACAAIFRLINLGLCWHHNKEIARLRKEEAELIAKISMIMRKD
jgi:hypothetical protein